MTKAKQDAIKDVGGFVMGKLKGGRRKKDCVEFRSALTLDMDHAMQDIPEQVEMFFDFRCLIYVAAHLFWLQINLIDCHRINRYNDISIEKEKVPEHLFFCRDKCSGTIYKHGYYIKIRNRIQ